MKKLYSALLSLVMVFAFSGTGIAGSFNIGLITSPDSIVISNTTGSSSAAPMPGAAGSFADEFLFQVDVASNYGSSQTSISIAGGDNLTGLNSALYIELGDSTWSLLVSNVGVISGSSWLTALVYTPLSPDPDQYKLVVSGTKVDGFASYGGNLTVTPIPEPETYAMLAAGLGLMGFVARRRQRKGAVS